MFGHKNIINTSQLTIYHNEYGVAAFNSPLEDATTLFLSAND